MGYLVLSLMAGVTKGYCGKKTSGYVARLEDAALVSTIRMLFCILISLVILMAGCGLAALKIEREVLFITMISGITTALFVVCWILSVKKGAYMMIDVFLMAGVMVPLTGSAALYQETIKGTQWLGLAGLVLAVLLMCSYNSTIKGKMTISSLALLILCGVSNGLTDFSQKLFVNQAAGVPVTVFNFYTYLFAAMALGAFFFFSRRKEPLHHLAMEKKTMLGYLLVMALCLFANSFFKTKAAELLPAAQLYPMYQGASLILSSLMSALLFRERLTAKCIAGLLLSFAALVVINVL